MIKTESFYKRVGQKIIAILLTCGIIMSALVGIPQFMTNEKYVDKIEFEAKPEENLPQLNK